jgi:hypothetical protein
LRSDTGIGPRDSSVRLSSPASTSLKPRESVQKSSSTEMSNDRLVTASHASPSSYWMRWSMAAKKLATLPWPTMTPLGVPVEPEV